MARRVLAVGLGNMGYPLSGRVAGRFDTAVHDLRTDTVHKHNLEYGSTAVQKSLRDTAAASDVILTCLPNTHLTLKVVEEIGEVLRPGMLWIDATSGKAEDARALATRLWEERQVEYADCAVSGGPAGARRGQLSIMMGGNEGAAEKAREVVQSFGAAGKIFHCGPPGSGHAVKAVNNALLAVSLLAAGEGIGVLTRMGIDPKVAAAAISESSGRSWATMQRFPDHVLTGEPYGFALGLHRKDVENALLLFEGGNADGIAPMLSQTAELMREAERVKGSDACHCDVAHHSAERIGGSLSSPSTA
eukprot:Hpha_TRINITY_DN15984_c2_g1::TRINITY_DN15984_c2_g1_i1::g.72847::m.72847/K00020/mmsB, HIBADH; 3-hydroxyisobutyrate dehydrogenase